MLSFTFCFCLVAEVALLQNLFIDYIEEGRLNQRALLLFVLLAPASTILAAGQILLEPNAISACSLGYVQFCIMVAIGIPLYLFQKSTLKAEQGRYN